MVRITLRENFTVCIVHKKVCSVVNRFYDKRNGSEACRHRNELASCSELPVRSPLSKLNDLVDNEARNEDAGKSLPNEAVNCGYG